MVAATQNFVRYLGARRNISNHNLFAFGNHYATLCSRIMRSARAAPTERFNLESIHAIGKFN
jgi:hypothetical protein